MPRSWLGRPPGRTEARSAPEDLTGVWRLEPIELLAAAVALALFTPGFVRLRRRRRRDHASWARAWLFVAGIAVALAALSSPLDAVGEQYLASGHTLQHVLVGDVAPALLVVAIRGPQLFFLLPADLMRALAQLRFLALMVLYTFTGLWVLGQALQGEQ